MTPDQRIAQLERQVTELTRLFINHTHKGSPVDRTKLLPVGSTLLGINGKTGNGGDIEIFAGNSVGGNGGTVYIGGGSSDATNATGDIVLGGGIATADNSGFIRIPSCAGIPTGTPLNTPALVYDTTNNKLYIYNGSWRSVLLA